MTSRLQQALNVSLDEYIAEKGIVSTLRPNSKGSKESAENFKRQFRSEQDEEEEDILIVDDRSSLDADMDINDEKPASLSMQVDTNCAVRAFVTEEQKQGIKNMPSQQWRLSRQNQVHHKPKGIPPLMAVKKLFDENTERLIASLGEHAKFKDPDAKMQLNGRQNNQGNRNFNRRNRINNRNRNQFNGNMNRPFNNQNNFNHNRNNYHNQQHNNQHDRFKPQNNRIQQNNNRIQDLRSMIGAPQPWNLPQQTSLVSGTNHFNAPQLVTFADMLNRIGQASTTQERETFADVFRNIMRNQQQQVQQQQPPQQTGAMVQGLNPEKFAQMNTSELMPYAANTLYNHITTVCQNFGPKYDMRVQKEIHALQGKQMLYRSQGVVTMDGEGVGNERIKPATTDLSMNMRFC